MTCVLPFHSGDSSLALDLMRWIYQLGGCPGHRLLIIADPDAHWLDYLRICEIARKSFTDVKSVVLTNSVVGWPKGANAVWLEAAKTAEPPWLFLEPDSVPMKTGWLDYLEAEYRRLEKPIMACVYDWHSEKRKVASGVAVYGQGAASFIDATGDKAFDIASADKSLPATAHTDLIAHFWGEPGLPPTFVNQMQPDSPRNALLRSGINPKTVLFHRCKDGSLTRLLREEHKVTAPHGRSLVVVLPVCNADIVMASKNLKWISVLGGCKEHDAILAYDPSINGKAVYICKDLAEKAFGSVKVFVYPVPPRQAWPEAPNWAFQHVARHMQLTQRPWLWLEADAIPLCPGWLDRIEREYFMARKPVMGAVVPGMGHVNGVAVYPWNFAELSPIAMSVTSVAWDYMCKPDISGHVHDCSSLIQHAWGLVGGRLHPREGPSPTFSNPGTLAWIEPGAVLFHRCKDGTLIDRLLEARR